MTIDELVQRGRVRFLAWSDARYPQRMVGSETLFVVTREDFIRYAAVCLEALAQRRSLYILGTDGSIETLLCRHKIGN